MSENTYATTLLNAGLSVIPIKMPGKRPTIEWTEYQHRPPRAGELSFNGSMALICGKVSGNVECFDIDTKHDVDGTLMERMKESFGDFWEEIQHSVVIQKTISGGYHFIYKCTEISGNKKLARNKAGEVILETRGEGGYFVIYPTPGYSLIHGTFDAIPTITVEMRQKLFDCAALLNEHFTEEKIPTKKSMPQITNGEPPWVAYDNQTDGTELLQKHGWTFVKAKGQVEFYKRPGNSDSLWSGSWHNDKNTFYVYTSSAPPLQQEKAYTPYALLTHFEFNGDFSESAKALLKQGFGSTQAKVTTTNESGETVTEVLTRVRRIELWLNDNYEFQRNVITSRLMYRSNGKPWEKCNEKEVWRQIQLNIHKLGKGPRGGELSVPMADIYTILESDFVKPFRPIEAYFDSLQPWDQEYDHITNLANHIKTTDQSFWIEQFKKALVRMIGCSMGHNVNRIVMTLISEEQEIGKSRAIRFLCPPQLKEYYKEEAMLHDKDSEIALSENFIWNLEELDDLNKKQISEMKAIISRDTIKQRRAYARYEETLPRIVNFWGSTNKLDFLTDTQNTRWLCFNVISIDHNYNNTDTGVKNIDINKVWAQALHLYKSGFNYQLSSTERVKRDLTNSDFETMPEEKQLILRFFLPSTASDPTAKFMVNFDIKEYLNQNTSAKNRFNEYNIGRSMKQLGFKQEIKKMNGKTVRGYWVSIQYIPPTLENADGQQKEPEIEPELPF